ncbi:MAG: hypothetical protein OQL19_21270 [Gammaproteobacteria bacterium]|nr:hypothetical protein [Gammaproteobacteria bacterium]
MSELTNLRQTMMEYYHKKILKFFSGTNKTYDIPHMHFDNTDNPKLILHDDSPVYIGRIEVDNEGISNFIHDTPLTFGCDVNCETISMQDFIIHGRLPSLSTIRQTNNEDENTKYYAYQTINGIKSERQEIFPLLRAQSTQTSYLLRNHLNHLLNSKEKQIEISLSEHAAEFEWIMKNEDRFGDVCNRLEIAIFKTPTHIMLTRYASADEIKL